MEVKEVIDALRRLVECPDLQEPDLHRDSFEEETVLALTEARRIISTCHLEGRYRTMYVSVVVRVCDKCGGNMERETDTHARTMYSWKCPQCGTLH